MKRTAARELSFMRIAYVRGMANDLRSDAELVKGTRAHVVFVRAAWFYERAYQLAKRKARLQ